MDLKLFPKSTQQRPNSFKFDLGSLSTASSGYVSAAQSTEQELPPPFDWNYLDVKLKDLHRPVDDSGDLGWDILHNLKTEGGFADLVDEVGERVVENLVEEKQEEVQVSLQTLEPVQYVRSDCHFTVEVNGGVSAFDDDGIDESFDDFEAYVVGPSGFRCNVTRTLSSTKESKIVSRKWSQVICTFRPLECGPHICHVTVNSGRNNPAPLTINISRKYQDPQTFYPIVNGDIELPNENENMEARKPWGLCSNTKTEQVIIADREKHEIIILGTDGEIEFSFGKEGKGPGEFFRPTAVAYDETRERILVADKDNHRIQVFSSQGEFITMFGRKGKYNGQFFFPWGIAVSKDGKYIAVADSRNHRVQLFDAHGKFLKKFTLIPENPGQKYPREPFGPPHINFKQEFDYPRGICFDNEGEYLYVTDFNLHNLLKIDINHCQYEKLLTERELKRPQGVAVDEQGNVLVCDSRNNRIKVLSPAGKLIADIDKIGSSRIELPLDIACGKGGFLAVLDMNGRVRVF